jgi:excisionase family DNA binding protein
MPTKSLEERQTEMRERTRFCLSCGSGLDEATVSVSEVVQYLERATSYLPLTQAAEYLGVSRRFLESRKAEIPHYRPGGKLLFKRSDLDQWMAQYRREPATIDLNRLIDEVVEQVTGKPKEQRPAKGVGI